jgi:hypothetical protein
MKLLWRILSPFVLIVAFTAPVYAFITASAAPGLPPRQTPPPVTAIPVATIPSYDSMVPVLVYHDISNAGERYTVTPQAFATQMAALHRAGFHTVTARQMLAFLHDHAQLPDRPLLIAFDDGLGPEWRVADPILAKYHMHATAFAITRRVQHGFYYLHPAETEAMIESGRWDMERHADVKKYYVWGRTFRARVYHKTTAKGLLELLKARTPLPVGIARMPHALTVLGRRHATLAYTHNGVLTLAPRVKHWLAVSWEATRTTEWSNYHASVTIGNLGAQGSGTSGSLVCGKYAVTISAGRLRVTSGNHHWQSVIPEAFSHKISVTTTRALQVAVDGRVVKTINIPRTHGGVSFGAWRANARSLYPSFSHLIVNPV